jgi:membrane protein implicated in regulation of membrane protease activity
MSRARLSPRLPCTSTSSAGTAPAGWLLPLWPTLSALWIAADGFPGWHHVAVFVLGTVLMRSAGRCVNDVADRDFDRHVKRTAQRPVTTGAVSVREALAVGAGLALAAFGLVLTTNPPTILLSFAALAVTLAYPYAKRLRPRCPRPRARRGLQLRHPDGLRRRSSAARMERCGGGRCGALGGLGTASPPTSCGCSPTTPSTPWSTATMT